MTIYEAIIHCEEVMVENLEKTKDRNASDPIAINCFECAEEHRQLAEWLKELKRLLEQQPCEDCISRQAVLEEAFEVDTKEYGKIEVVGVDAINSLPPVTPQEPKTVLYSGDGYADGYMVYDMAECPNCGYEYEDGDKDWGLSFCPNCGQKLNWESEVRNG